MLEKGSGEGQWLSLAGAGNAPAEFPACREQGHAPMLPRKASRYRNASRTKTDTGGRVQKYQGAREKPR